MKLEDTIPMTPVQNAINHLSRWIENRIAQSKRRAAVKSVLIAIAKRHPDWTDVGFDEHFITHQGAPLLADYFRSGQLPDAATLADAWSNQFFWQPTTKRGAQIRFMPIAEDFVDILRTESRQPESTFVQRQ